jgi:hypothetical protein
MKKIELKNDSFELNGKQWHIYDDVTLERLGELEKIIHHFINGVDLVEQQVIMQSIYKDMNEQRFADAAVKLHNFANATIVKKNGMVHPKLLIATMFINEKGENLSEWNLDIANSKIKAWEGAEAAFFLKLAEKRVTATLQLIFGISETISKALVEVGESRMRFDPPAMVTSPDSGTRSKMKSRKNGH